MFLVSVASHMVITGQQVFDIDFLRYILADKCRLLAELPLPVFSPCSALSPVCAEERFLSAVERWIGKINGDILAIPTLDLYRECRRKIPYLNMWWWLATPDSTPSGSGYESVRFIDSEGRVDCVWCGSSALVVRPFFILKEPL